jgi:phosphoenolpyruvate synthase/pyruvate phosphate dikinase
VDAVFGSWNSPRAQVYRRLNDIPDDLGTAVNVMQMVFGNKGGTSATGVCLTRNPATGARPRRGGRDRPGDGTAADRPRAARPGPAPGAGSRPGRDPAHARPERVAWLGVERGLRARPDLEIGVCGEHGGDPASITVFDGIGIDYVSCSPYRVPIARPAAARARLETLTYDDR